MLVAAFATLALSLALLGVYGLVSFAVERRTREIGVRMALGARPESVSALVLGKGMKLASAGIVGGLVLSRWLGKYLEGLLFGTEAADPTHLVLPVVLLVTATLAATWLPARRATRVEPSVALRAD